jgi:hypothetical protein
MPLAPISGRFQCDTGSQCRFRNAYHVRSGAVHTFRTYTASHVFTLRNDGSSSSAAPPQIVQARGCGRRRDGYRPESSPAIRAVNPGQSRPQPAQTRPGSSTTAAELGPWAKVLRAAEARTSDRRRRNRGSPSSPHVGVREIPDDRRQRSPDTAHSEGPLPPRR